MRLVLGGCKRCGGTMEKVEGEESCEESYCINCGWVYYSRNGSGKEEAFQPEEKKVTVGRYVKGVNARWL